MENETYESVRRSTRRNILRFAVGVLQADPDISGRDLLRMLARDAHERDGLDPDTLTALRGVGVDVDR